AICTATTIHLKLLFHHRFTPEMPPATRHGCEWYYREPGCITLERDFLSKVLFRFVSSISGIVIEVITVGRIAVS
ncbi:MAG TPA: hypothetical protein VE134_06915, partial [Methanomicrobiales archaeon]|nr:hypothetical protein [Methanomicrobiales archaeon]